MTLFGVISGLGVEIDTSTGDFWGTFVPPQTARVTPLATQNSSGAWWQVYVGPVFGVESGTTDNGVNYQELHVYTGFAEYQVQGQGPFWGGPSLLQRYWLTQKIRITQGGSGSASCSGSSSPPPGCEECNN